MNFRISRLFLYYNVRKLYNEKSDDNGSRIIDCINILNKKGVPPELVHPYNEKFIYNKPNKLANRLAKYCKLLVFKEVDYTEIKKELLAEADEKITEAKEELIGKALTSKKSSKVGTKIQVWNSEKMRTAGGLKKSDLMKNKRNKIVSKKQYEAGQNAYLNLERSRK